MSNENVHEESNRLINEKSPCLSSATSTRASAFLSSPEAILTFKSSKTYQ